jgi:GAF domain-containing protein
VSIRDITERQRVHAAAEAANQDLHALQALTSLAGVPLLVGNQVLGVLHVRTTLPRQFTTRDVQLLHQVADRMALAIDRARLYRREQQAREHAEAVMEAVPDALAVDDTNGTILLHNAAADLQFTRLSRQMALGETVGERYQQAGGAYDVEGTLLWPEQWAVSRALL